MFEVFAGDSLLGDLSLFDDRVFEVGGMIFQSRFSVVEEVAVLRRWERWELQVTVGLVKEREPYLVYKISLG